jgi:hypothetical protein
MAKATYQGNARSIAQEKTARIGVYAAAATYTITATNLNTGDNEVEVYTVLGTEGSTSGVATEAVEQFSASVKKLFQRVEFTIDEAIADKIIMTAKLPGEPFSYALTAGAGGAWTEETNVQANSGPSDWKLPANWAGNAVPAANDDITIADGSAPILHNLNDSAKAYGKITRAHGCAADIGGGPGDRLRVASCTGLFDYGSGRMFIDVGTSAIAPEIYNKRQAFDYSASVDIIGSAMTACHVFCGRVIFGANAGDSVPMPTVNNHGGYVILGPGVTGHTTWSQKKGDGEIHCAAQDMTVAAGTLRHLHTSSDALGNIKADGATAKIEIATPGGQVTLSEAYGGGKIIYSHPTATRTIVTMKEDGVGGHIYDPAKVTPTNYVATAKNRFGGGAID